MHTQDNFMPSVKKHNSLSLGPMYSFHLLLLKSSLWDQTVLCLNVVVPQRQNNLLKMNLWCISDFKHLLIVTKMVTKCLHKNYILQKCKIKNSLVLHLKWPIYVALARFQAKKFYNIGYRYPILGQSFKNDICSFTDRPNSVAPPVGFTDDLCLKLDLYCTYCWSKSECKNRISKKQFLNFFWRAREGETVWPEVRKSSPNFWRTLPKGRQSSFLKGSIPVHLLFSLLPSFQYSKCSI